MKKFTIKKIISLALVLGIFTFFTTYIFADNAVNISDYLYHTSHTPPPIPNIATDIVVLNNTNFGSAGAVVRITNPIVATVNPGVRTDIFSNNPSNVRVILTDFNGNVIFNNVVGNHAVLQVLLQNGTLTVNQLHFFK